MTGGGHSTLLRTAAPLASALQVCALLLGLLAGACWFWASTLPVELELLTATVPSLQWWSSAGVMAGIAVSGLTCLAWMVRGRAGFLVLGVVLLGSIAGGLAFWWLVVPNANPIHPIGPAVPYGLAGFLAAGAAGLMTAFAVALSGGWRTAREARQPSGLMNRYAIALLVGCVAAVAGAAVLIIDLSRAYLLEVNEYRTVGDVDSPPGPVPASTLSGGDHWRVQVPGLNLAKPANTAFGVAVTSGQSVVMLDRATGSVRWRYTRSDITGDASVASTGDGRQVLVWWATGTVYVLDARTGEQVGNWTGTTASNILDAGPPLIIRTGPDGRTRVVRVSSDAVVDLWSFSLGGCRSARATPAGTRIVLALSGCKAAAGQLVGLESTTGRLLWILDNVPGDVSAVVDGAALVLSPPDPAGASRRLKAIDLDDGGTRWTRELPQLTGMRGECEGPVVYADVHVAEMACNWEPTNWDPLPDVSRHRFAATVYTYDTETGSSLREITFLDGQLGSMVVTADGRALVTHGDWEDGCVLDVVVPKSKARTGSIQPGLVHECAYLLLVALEDQVLVLDTQRGVIRSLR